MEPPLTPFEIEVIAPNLKRRLSGVTATVLRLVPIQARMIGIVTTGPGLPPDLPHVALWRIPFLPRRRRVWHARRNLDLLAGVVLKRLFRADYRMVFTSSSPRSRSRWTRWLLGQCDQLVATHERNARVMPGQCRVIPHGVDVTAFSPLPRGHFHRPDLQLIGCFGRIRPAKGTADLIEALCRLLPRHPGWGAVIMGRVMPKDTAFAEGLRHRVARAGLADRILFLPETPLTEMAAAYSDLGLYVSPSHLEGFGLTPLEAMACAVPVVASRGIGAFDEQIEDGVTGRLFRCGDPEDLEQTLAALISDPQGLARMAEAARRRSVDHFSIQAEAKALVALYREMLA